MGKRLRCACRKYGNAPYSIVLVHGGPGGGGDMAPIGRKFAPSRGVLEPIQSEHSLSSEVEELYDVIVNIAMTPVTLIGHSWGAWLSIFCAAKYPDTVKSLILVGSAPFEEEYVMEFRSRLDSHLSVKERKELLDVRSKLMEATGAERERLFNRLGELSDKGYDFSRTDGIILKEDEITPDAEIHTSVWAEAKAIRMEGGFGEYLSTIRCPVLVVHGDYDPHPMDGVRIPLGKFNTNARFITLEKCGHTPWVERFAMDEFYRILEAELGRQ